jgi:hypothetical protein
MAAKEKAENEKKTAIATQKFVTKQKENNNFKGEGTVNTSTMNHERFMIIRPYFVR